VVANSKQHISGRPIENSLALKPPPRPVTHPVFLRGEGRKGPCPLQQVRCHGVIRKRFLTRTVD
jgi:hypothetical protein